MIASATLPIHKPNVGNYRARGIDNASTINTSEWLRIGLDNAGLALFDALGYNKEYEASQSADCVNNDRQGLMVQVLEFENKVFEFKTPQLLNFEKLSDCVRLIYPPLEIEEMASSEQQCLNELAGTLNFLWVAYATCEDSKLDKGARVLKQKILSLVSCREN